MNSTHNSKRTAQPKPTRADYWIGELHQAMQIAGIEHLTASYPLQEEVLEEAIAVFTNFKASTPLAPGFFGEADFYIFNDGSSFLIADSINPETEEEKTVLRVFGRDMTRQITKQLQKDNKTYSCWGRKAIFQ
jgi:hypothetical protein